MEYCYSPPAKSLVGCHSIRVVPHRGVSIEGGVTMCIFKETFNFIFPGLLVARRRREQRCHQRKRREVEWRTHAVDQVYRCYAVQELLSELKKWEKWELLWVCLERKSCVKLAPSNKGRIDGGCCGTRWPPYILSSSSKPLTNWRKGEKPPKASNKLWGIEERWKNLQKSSTNRRRVKNWHKMAFF